MIFIFKIIVASIIPAFLNLDKHYHYLFHNKSDKNTIKCYFYIQNTLKNSYFQEYCLFFIYFNHKNKFFFASMCRF